MRVFRTSLALALALPVLAAPRHARAESFFEIAGGLAIPMGDDDWTDVVESSPKLGIKAGAVPDKIGGAISADWTPENTDLQDASGPLGSADYSAHRFRILANVLFQVPLKAKMQFEGRAGIGVDIAHASAEFSSPLGTTTFSDTDAGLGFEFGAGMWFDVSSIQLGAQVAVPIGIHNHKADNNNEIAFDYTSYDFDLLFGVRLLAK